MNKCVFSTITYHLFRLKKKIMTTDILCEPRQEVVLL